MGKADMVIGKRINIGAHNRNSPFLRKIGLWLFQLIFQIKFPGHRISDFMSGMRAFSRKVRDSLSIKSCGFGIETEITIKAIRGGFTVKEVDVLVSQRKHGMQKSNMLNVGLPVLKELLL